MAIVVDIEKICSEMLDVLVKNKVPVCALDRVLQHLKELAYCNTLVQNVDPTRMLERCEDIDGQRVCNKVLQ